MINTAKKTTFRDLSGGQNMEVTCDKCHVKLNVPDEKIPKNNAVKINCPKCSSEIVIDPREKVLSNKATQPEQGNSGDQKAEEAPETSAGDHSGDNIDLQFSLDDPKLALVMTNNDIDTEKIKDAVEKLGYRITTTENTRDALIKMKEHLYDLFILTDGFDNNTLSASPVLNYLNNISMADRRRMFIALIGDQFKSMDEPAAFSISADVVINSSDQEKLFSILKKSIVEKERFYSVFMEILKETGRY